MRNNFKFLACTIIALSVASCGNKKEKDLDFGTKTEEIQTEEVAANPMVEQGAALFVGKGNCTSCHKENEKNVGPSITDIASIYKEKGASIAAFINEESEAIVDPAQYEVMKTNFPITKAMSQEERDALEAYMMSY